jgi:2',3'-cyclic-nucleotide 2'-phosphodiesterase (5'-nucleotidase family)
MKTLKKLWALPVFALAIGILAGVESCKNEADNPGGSATPGNNSVTIDVYSFTDFHGVMENSEDTEIADTRKNPGAARFIAVLREMMSKSENSLLLSSGDNYHNWDYDNAGNKNLSNIFKGAPVSDMMRNIGLKYSVIGNHEWDWGEHFAYFSGEGGITYLAANVFLKGTETRPGFCKPYVIETIAGKKIGVVGLTIVNMERFTADFVPPNAGYSDGYDFKDAGPWLKEMVADLKTNQGCDAVIALTHLDPETVNKLVGDNDKGFDAIILGHTHTTSDRLSFGVPTIQPAHYGRGIAKLSFVFDKKGLAEVKRENVTVLDVPGDEVDEKIAAMVAEYRKAKK